MISRTRIKICGLTRLEDVRLAASLGADALGFVFAPGARYLTPREARDLTAAVPAWINRVGVFGPDRVREAPVIAEACRLDTLQLHGDPDPAFAAYFRGRFSIVQALGVGEGASLNALQDAIDLVAPHVDAVLLDTLRAGMLGGTGEAFDWARLGELVIPCPLVVAGGLNAQNVGALLESHAPWGVDVSSGVEAAPGRKDPVKLEAFFSAVAAQPR